MDANDRSAEDFWATARTLLTRFAARGHISVGLHLARLTNLGQHSVPIERLAQEVGRPAEETATLAQQGPGGHWVRVNGGQITLDLSQHTGMLRRRLRIGQRVFPVSGCAPDVLLWAAVLDEPLTIEETCPATGAPIQVDLTPDGVAGLDPAEAVVVYPALPAFDEIAAMPSEEIDATICSQGPLFASAEAASTWVTDHPGVHVFGIRDAYDHLREIARALLKAVSPTTQ